MATGIDIGYEETKYATADGTGAFSSALAANSTDDPLFRTSRRHHVQVKWGDGRTVERLAGEAALRHPGMVQIRAQEKPAEDHDLLLLTAAYLAGEDGPFDVGVGLPLGFYRHQEAILAARLRSLAATVTVDQGDSRRLSNRLFTTWAGRPGHPEWPSQWFPKFLRRHGLPSLSLHGLRHTGATLLLAEGIPLKSVSARLGHSGVGITGDLYGHALPSVDRLAADKLENILKGEDGPKEEGKEEAKDEDKEGQEKDEADD